MQTLLSFAAVLLLTRPSTSFQGFSAKDLMQLQGVNPMAMLDDLDTSFPSASYDELYTEALDAYEKESWTKTIKLMERAIDDYNKEREGLRQCKVACAKEAESEEVPAHLKGIEFSYFHNILSQAGCLRQCKRDKFGNRMWAAVSEDILKAFRKRLPHMYLQLAYYKAGETVKAARSAATYLYYNPDDETAKSNAKFYESLPEVTEDVFKPIDIMKHMESFERGITLYDEKKWEEAVVEFENAVQEYLEERKMCRLLCDGNSIEKTSDVDAFMSNHVASLLQCRQGCVGRLATNRKGEEFEKFFEGLFHYLQFVYFKGGNLTKAVECATTYLLYHPEDEVMLKNVQLYKGFEGVSDGDFVARQEIVGKFNIEEMERKLLLLAEGPTARNEEDEFRKNIEEDEAWLAKEMDGKVGVEESQEKEKEAEMGSEGGEVLPSDKEVSEEVRDEVGEKKVEGADVEKPGGENVTSTAQSQSEKSEAVSNEETAKDENKEEL
eukprot:m.308037 g.308037  ORF g.308037 m.308037 type:complete len:495 (+) comp43296_c0_seq1:37-1521(+)